MQLKFDGTVNLGHLLTAAAMVSSVAIAWGNLRKDSALLELRVAVVERTLERMSSQDSRITTLESTTRGLAEVPNLLRDLKTAVQQLDAGVGR